MPEGFDGPFKRAAKANKRVEARAVAPKNPVYMPIRPYVAPKAAMPPPARKAHPYEPKVDPIDLDKVLRKPWNRVALAGVELEGGWLQQPEGMPIVRDGSVFKHSDLGGFDRRDYPGHLCGEVTIGPMRAGQIAAAMRKAWPQVKDASCGMHVHMSFETVLQYAILTDSPAYQETILEYLKRWAKTEDFPLEDPIWGRLSGESEYCQKKFWPMAQMEVGKKDHDKERHGHRYTVIHYAWERFKTIECRVLPMMKDVEQGIRAVREVIDITNAYLVLAEKKKVREVGDVKLENLGPLEERDEDRIRIVMDSGDVYEEYIETKL